MTISYRQISKEIGYTGYMPYPSKERVKALFHNLCANPTIGDFKAALRLFRFAPEAKTPAQTEMIYMIHLGLAVAGESLYLTQSRWTVTDVFRYQLFKLIPSMSLFYMLRITLSDIQFGIF